ncbi:ISLre2 family transposase [Lapidilactobacillus luobeiensis]|uniref:ISLre2 family transposase n=1 Tax=Lapidilactobacillus luobeiensis TaxID=2950371 RepID=UPI0021C404A9|nr:ISLre2 family transposase [Lapidilactobacillus luobeiensis]
MESIVAVTRDILKKTESFIQFEAKFIPVLAELVCTQVAEAFEELDDQLCLGKDWEILRRDKRTVQCLFGTLQFHRRLVRSKDGKQSYPLDTLLGLACGRRYSPMMMAQVANLASHAVLRTVSMAVDAFTPGSISFQTVDKIYQQVGADLKEVEAAKAAAAATSNEPKRVVSRLFIEGDAFQIKLKGGRRIYVHRLQVSEGVEKNGKRHQLINRKVFSGLDREKVFDQMSAYLDAHYDNRITEIITGSDNGSGYEPNVFQVFAKTRKQHTHILDVYHLNSKLKERFNMMPVELKQRLRKAIFTGDHKRVNTVMDTVEAIVTGGNEYDQDDVENVESLRNYLDCNWTSIAPLATVDWHHTGLGSCESNHRAYTYRLKKQGRSWSVPGLTAMLEIIDAVQNHELAESLSQTTVFDTPLPSVDSDGVQIPKDFSLKTLFGGFARADGEHAEHVGARRGVIDAQGLSGTSFGRMAHSLNNLNLIG